jgi:hypothetical protein
MTINSVAGPGAGDKPALAGGFHDLPVRLHVPQNSQKVTPPNSCRPEVTSPLPFGS